MYNTLLELEDAERHVHQLPDCPTRDLYLSTTRRLTKKLYRDCISTCGATLLHTLGVRKGKSLIGRLLSWLDESDCVPIVFAVMRNFGQVTRRDQQDNRLPTLWPAAERVIATATTEILLNISNLVNEYMNTGAGVSLPLILTNKVSLILFLAEMKSSSLYYCCSSSSCSCSGSRTHSV